MNLVVMRKLLAKVTVAAVICVLGMSSALAQARVSFNQGFEVPTRASLDPNTELYEEFGSIAFAVPQSVVPGWSSTHPPTCFGEPCIEIWDSGNAHSGNQYIELDAYQPSAAFTDDICLINGEQLSWSFWHRNRSGGPDEVRFEIDNGAQILATQNTASTTVWAQNTGVATINVPTGLHSFDFVSVLPGGNNTTGNFLDDVSITLLPLIEFDLAASAGPEGGSTVPQVRVNGVVPPGGFSVPISVIAGGTTAGAADYTIGATVFIPAGTYAGNDAASLIDLPFTSTQDTEIEGDETVEFQLGSGNGYIIAPADCAGAANASTTYTITDDDARLTLQKTIVNTGGGPITDDTVWTLGFDGGTAGAAAGAEGDAAVTAAAITPGTFTLTETGGPATYSLTDLACTGAADTTTSISNLSVDIAVGEDVVCTFTNTYSPTFSFTVDKTTTGGPSLGAGANSAIMDPGDTITYDVLVENTGNEVLSNVVLSESLSGAVINCPSSGSATITSIPVGGDETCAVTYTLLQSDFDTNGDGDGDIDNVVTATVTNGIGTFVEMGTEEVPIVTVTDIDITKVPNPLGPVGAGDVINYTYTVRNIGNVTVNGLTVSDVANGSDPDPVPANETLATIGGVPVSPTTADAASDGIWDALGAGDSVAFSASYTVTQADVDTLQ